MLRLCTLDPLDERLAKLAGLALAQVDAGVVDAVVAASAAGRGDVVLTSDPQDLLQLSDFFPALRVATLS